MSSAAPPRGGPLTPAAATFAPRPGAAPLPRIVRTHAAMEVRLLVRNGEQLLLALVIPLLVLVGGTAASGVLDVGSGRRVDVLTPGVFALAVLSTAFTSLAIATAYERRYGVLKRLGASPLPRTGLLAGKVLAVVVVEAAQLLLVGAVALALGWQPRGGPVGGVSVLLLVVVGTAAFGSLGLAMAGSLRAEATLAAANLAYLLLVAFGAVVVPTTSYPSSLQPFIGLLPSGALVEGLRETIAGAGGVPWLQLGVLLGWAVIGTVLCARTFRWE